MAAIGELTVYVDADMATRALIDILEIVREPKCQGIVERCNRLDRIARVAARALRQLKVREDHDSCCDEGKTDEAQGGGEAEMAGPAPVSAYLPGFE